MQSQKSALITVGTTHFEALIKHTDSQPFVDLLASHGYTKLTYQIGRGHYTPTHGCNFRLTPHINEYFNKADLIITHGGAGTLLQNLVNGKLIIGVANEELMGNHQAELVEKLGKQGYILGFGSIKELQSGADKIGKFLEQGCSKKFQRPGKCVMNELVFGQGKDN